MANISQKWLNENMLEILSLFPSECSKGFHGSQIAKKLKLPQRTISRNLNKLGSLNLVEYVREGRNKIYFINKNFPQLPAIFNLIESYKSVKFLLKNKEISLMLNELSKNNKLVVFGSYAKGLNKKTSDVDILLLAGKSKKVSRVLSKYNFKTHIQYSNPDEFERKLKSKNNLAIEIMDNHIIISGFEYFIKVFMNYE